MNSMVDPFADDVWNSVAFVNSKAGAENGQPRTNEEWKAVRRKAIALSETTNVLVCEVAWLLSPIRNPARAN